MKKVFSIFIALLFVFSIAACGSKTPATKKIELRYADWADAKFNKRMIDKFMEKYPNIKVSLSTEIAGSGDAFTGNLVTAAQNGLLPDVYATDNVPTIINYGLARDLSGEWNKDPDAALVYENIAKTAVYNDHRYAVPSFQFLKGIFINLDIFAEKNLTTVAGKYRIDNDGYPTKDWTHAEFVEIAKAVTNFDLSNTENLVVGFDTWYGAPDFQQVWPTMNDANVQYDTWDGTKFNYTSDAWINSMKAKVEIDNYEKHPGVTSRYSPADLVKGAGVLDTYIISTGYAAMDIEGSWQFDFIRMAQDDGTNLGFWPYPSGSEGLFPPTILDFAAVSSQTEYPDEAFLLAKWMTFGKDGWNARLDLYEEDRVKALSEGKTPSYLDRFPIANYPGVWDKVYNYVDGIEGINYTLDRIENSKPDLDKWLAGYKDFWAWANDPENEYGWVSLQLAGPDAVPAFAAQWNAKVNELVSEQIANLGKEE
ncbi:MAG TPA: ABC transporter substrate-binding protein [Acholeplasma sp.]|nr:ABC transporter substrate-binding protein [Acholeplasma sp.]